MHRPDETNASHFFIVSFEKSEAFLQSLYVVEKAPPAIAWTTHPSTERPSLVTVIEMENRDRVTTALTKTI
jgi:hypothetical protein